MKFRFPSITLVSLIILIITFKINAQDRDLLKVESVKEVGQVEVGGPYVGIGIHKSIPLLNRISFYYPVANSIDISDDYWTRENFRIMAIGLKVGDSPKRFLKNQVYKVSQTPYSVSFSGNDSDSEIKIKYEFCKNEPAMVITYEITNTSDDEKEYEVFTRLETTLRTCHIYKIIDSAYTEFQENGSIIRINYPYTETGNSQIFVMNSGLKPTSYTTKEHNNNEYKNIDDWWLNSNSPLLETIIQQDKPSKPTAAFIYEKRLDPKTSIKIIQIVGSSLISEAKRKTDYLLNNYQKEVDEYEDYIIKESIDKNEIVTGNKDIDFTSRWSKAVLTTNAHYLNGQIVPMPAQAEYNFYFTHDALLTDLAAVNFDLDRVKNDLKYIISLADTDKIIPHAYYWEGTKYKTEFAGTGEDQQNWNHFWFTLVCASYLRHSGDSKFLDQLYPYIEKSIKISLKHKGDDDLMWSFRPDWWDIGNNFAPRAYMTILAIRALREFNYISTLLHKNNYELKFYEELADRMNRKLVDTLWDKDLNYLISYYEDGKEDKHIYMGSLLASHFNLMDEDKNLKLVTTAKEKLLDEKLGIYTLYPMDINLLTDYLKLSVNESGDSYYYLNGGIWPHGNAWYALALINNGLNKDALEFIKKTMTLNGIINSPNGQPALYEYRISDKNNPTVYGKIDKPQFLWAGGWYFYTLYNLFGLRENEWNISFSPFIPEEMDSVQLTVTLKGIPVIVDITGEGSTLSSILFDGKEIPSAIVPDDVSNLNKIKLKLGDVKTPYLKSVNAKVIFPMYDISTRTLEFDLESFEGHLIELKILSPTISENISINGNIINDGILKTKKNNIYEINLRHISSLKKNHYSIKFE